MKNTRKFLSVLLLVPMLLALLSSCGDEETEWEVVSDKALTYFNDAVTFYADCDCRSVTRAYAVLQKTDDPNVHSDYLQTYESLYHNNGKDSERLVESKYIKDSGDPAKIGFEKLEHFFTYYLKDGVCYYDFSEDTRTKTEFSKDYSAAIGLYSLSGRTPRSFYAVKGKDTVCVDLTFPSSDSGKMEDAFLSTMNLALFGGEVEMTFSDLTVRAYIDVEEETRFENYTVSFTGTAKNNPAYRVTYTFFEEFSDYGVKEKISFPDFSSYVEQKAE